MTRRIYRIIQLAISAFLTGTLITGCIRGGDGDCLDLTLCMQLQSVETRHLSNLQTIAVYIFDQDGVFLERYDAKPVWESDFTYTMKIPIEQEGNYQFVIWTNIDQECYRVTEVQKNTTRMQEASLEVSCGGDAVVEELPAMLCYGHHPTVEVKRGSPREIEVPMKRYTSMVQIVVHGLDDPENHSLTVEYGSRSYKFDAEEEESTTRTFHPKYVDETEYPLAGDFRLVRLNETRHSILKITENKTNSGRLNLDLIEEVLAKYPGLDFSEQFEFLVEITLRNYIPVEIKVNAWNVVEVEI